MVTKEFLLDTSILIEFIHHNESVVDNILKAGFSSVPGIEILNCAGE